MPILVGVLVVALILLIAVYFFQHSKRDNLKEDRKNSNNSSVIFDSSNSLQNSKANKVNGGVDLSSISEFIQQTDLGERLIWERPVEKSNDDQKYQEILEKTTAAGSRVLQGALPSLAQKQVLAEIKAQAPNGIFTTKINPKELSKFSDGTYTTMVRDLGNNLKGHEGFRRIELPFGNLAAVTGLTMQAMAMISGQYYLTTINSQLESIEKLIEFHHDEKSSDLLTAQDRLVNITERSHVSEADLNEIRNILDDTLKVYYEYKNRLDRQYTKILNSDLNGWRNKDKINSLRSELSDMNFTFQMCYEANKLSLQAGLSEIAVRLKMGTSYNDIEEYFESFRCNLKDSFYKQAQNNISELYLPIFSKAKLILKNNESVRFLSSNTQKELMSINDFFRQVNRRLDNKDTVELAENMMLSYEKSREILYVPTDDPERSRVFIATNKV